MIRLFFGLLLKFASHPAIVIRWSFTLQLRPVVIRLSLHNNDSLGWFARLIIDGCLSCNCYLLAIVIVVVSCNYCWSASRLWFASWGALMKYIGIYMHNVLGPNALKDPPKGKRKCYCNWIAYCLCCWFDCSDCDNCWAINCSSNCKNVPKNLWIIRKPISDLNDTVSPDIY